MVATDLYLPKEAASSERLTWHPLDVSRSEGVYKTMLSERPDAVIHLVSWLAGPCEADPLRGWEINFLSTQYLLDAGIAAGLKRFVFSSSISVFGKGVPEPVRDDAVKEPITMYGQTKLACEHLLRWYKNKHGIEAGAVRFPWVYGPGRETGITAMYSSKLLDALARKEPLHIAWPEEKGDWLYVRTQSGPCSWCSRARPFRKRDTTSWAASTRSAKPWRWPRKCARRPPSALSTTRRPPTIPIPLSYDDSLARRDLGWKPDYSLRRAFATTLRSCAGPNSHGDERQAPTPSAPGRHSV